MGMSIRSWPRRIRDSIEQEGLWPTLARALTAPAYQGVMIMSKPIELERIALAPVVVRPASLDDIDALVRLRREYKPSALRSRFLEGHRCFVSIVEGGVVACIWGRTEAVMMGGPALVLPLQEDEASLYDFYTDPRYRGGGVGDASHHALKQELLARGYRKMVGYATPGRRPYGRDNPACVATVRVMRLGPFRKFWVETYGPQAEYWRERLKELRWA
jgi:GNAT superfamily N-acetyltransferase